MDAQYLANIATIIGVIGALIGFAWGLYQFHRDAILRRVDHLGRIRSALVSNPESSEILHLLDTDDPRLAEKPVLDRRAFVCLMEEVALLERRDLIRPDLAYYMFGYAAIRCAESDYFWTNDFKKDEESWPLFFSFVRHMKGVELQKKSGKWKPERLKP